LDLNAGNNEEDHDKEITNQHRRGFGSSSVRSSGSKYEFLSDRTLAHNRTCNKYDKATETAEEHRRAAANNHAASCPPEPNQA